jgi:hypothetical protein
MHARWLVPFAATVVAASFVAAPARAEPTNREKADALFREGRAASQTGDWATACAKFAGSQSLDASVGTLLNLGDCSEHLGKWVVARAYFRDAIIKLDPSDPRVGQARERLKVLEGHLPKLTVTLAASAPAGTIVRCDGRALESAELGAPVPTDPGDHTCVAVAPGRAEVPQKVTVQDGAAAALEVVPGDPLPSGTPRETPPAVVMTGGGPSKRTIGWIVGGVGVAGLAVAGVSGLVLLGEKSTADSGCTNKTACNADALAAISANKTWLPVNTVAWIVGAVGVGVGAYLILTSKDGAPTARVGAMLLPGGGGASAQVVFE